jgi:hypothetical protein
MEKDVMIAMSQPSHGEHSQMRGENRGKRQSNQSRISIQLMPIESYSTCIKSKTRLAPNRALPVKAEPLKAEVRPMIELTTRRELVRKCEAAAMSAPAANGKLVRKCEVTVERELAGKPGLFANIDRSANFEGVREPRVAGKGTLTAKTTVLLGSCD